MRCSCFFLLLFVIQSLSESSLFFRACTKYQHRILLCINECETDAPKDDESFYSVRQIVLDLQTGKIEIAEEDKDTPIICPNLDDIITKQPHPIINDVKCGENRSLIWDLIYDGIEYPITVTTKAENFTKSKRDLWYNAFFFVTNTTDDLYFVVEGSNHLYYQGVRVHLKTKDQSEWVINLHDGESGLTFDYVLALVKYKNSDNNTDQCSTIQPVDIKTYPVLFETIKLIAFPDSKNEMWYKYNDTGLYKFSKSGLIDTRLNSIIEVSDMTVTLHNYDVESVVTFDLESQVAQYRVDRPLAVRPSIVIFSISFFIIVVLVISEVITQRRARKSSKNDDELELKDALLSENPNHISKSKKNIYDDEEEEITEIK